MTLPRTDKCGNPNPDVCIPQLVTTPICYTSAALQALGVTDGLPGFKVVQVNADCSGDVTEIQNANHVVVPGATEVPCPPCSNTFGPGGFAAPTVTPFND